MPFPLNVWLVHPERIACDSFAHYFAALPNVQVCQNTFENLEPHDAFVTAGNSFGVMTAGIDAAVIGLCGRDLMRRVQDRILDEYLGEQPVGSAFVISTGLDRLPWIVHAPTMRIPGSIAGSDKVYSATWAAFLAVYQHNVSQQNKISTVAFPAMGTGFGGVSFNEAARQMAAAYRHYLSPPHRLNFDVAIDRHKAIAYDGDRQVVR